MAASAQETNTRARLRQARLISGLVLMAFVVTHFLNHALGLHSIELMEAARKLLVFWHQPFVWPLLAIAVLVHAVASLIALYRRRTLKLPAWQWLQLITGLAIPFLLAQHYLGARWLPLVSGRTGGYPLELLVIWQEHPLRHFVGLFIVWVHGCAGMHYWLRLKPWYRPLQPLALALAVLIPVLAATGVMTGGREMAAMAADPDWLAAYAAAQNWPFEPEHFAFVYDNDRRILIGLTILLLLVLGGRLLRRLVQERHMSYRLAYSTGQQIRAPLGTTLLEASRLAGIPHAAACGGRGRCSTCRVRITAGGEALPAPAADELRVLERLGAAADVRLACQARPAGDVAITPLVAVEAEAGHVMLAMNPSQGAEREIVVLFADLRGFTRISEGRLPYDVVHLLNRYFRTMGDAIDKAGGHVDKVVGDGIMALFGLATDPETAARQALEAVRAMGEALDTLNREFASELAQPLRMAVGLHQGTVIVGELGYGASSSLTAIGDTVNVASRLEGVAKEHDVALAVSATVLSRAGLSEPEGQIRELAIRGRSKPLPVSLIANVRSLPTASAAAAPVRLKRRRPWRLRATARGTAG